MMTLDRITPRLSVHARQRCVEMGITTKRAKRVVQDPTITRPGNPGTNATVATSEADPELAVVYAPDEDGVPIILTVLWNGVDFVRGEACPFRTG